jgi:hypothetical protein
MAVGAFGVHQLRYGLAFGEHAHEALAEQGHGYLDSAPLVLGLLVAAALGMFLRRLAVARDVGAEDSSTRSVLWLWLAASAGLVAIYAGQELIEGVLSSGHPGGLHGVFGHGGWIAIPSAVPIGGTIALAVRVAHAVVAYVARPRREAPRGRRRATGRRVLPSVVLPRLAPLASASAGRAPPTFADLTVV